MTVDIETPSALDGFRDAIHRAVKEQRTLWIKGGQSKVRPCVEAGQERGETDREVSLSTQAYAGIVDHQASDFTITVKAGTKVREVLRVLQGAGQHLPFDPTCVERGATIGGLVAAGFQGPCRLRHGGLRDFVIGCQYIDGQGNVVRAGGKVVKNAAGFDLPKFFVGSGGRFGLITEMTFKVFPRPKLYRTFRFANTELADALACVRDLVSVQDFEAIEVLSTNEVLARISGEAVEVLDLATRLISERISGDFTVGDENAGLWQELADMTELSEQELLVKIPLCFQQIAAWDDSLASLEVVRRYTAAGNACLIQVTPANIEALNDRLLKFKLAGQVVMGPSRHFLLGHLNSLSFLKRVKRAMDPQAVFGDIEPAACKAIS